MISQMCWTRSTCVWITCSITSGYSATTAGELSSVFTQQIRWCAQSLSWKYICVLLVRQEHESAAGPGWELRAGPDLHHREDHFCLLPQQRGRAELCSQPAGGCLNAALQAWPKLPGMLFFSSKQRVHWGKDVGIYPDCPLINFTDQLLQNWS